MTENKETMLPFAWLDENGALIRRSDIKDGGYVDKDRAFPDCWKPLYTRAKSPTCPMGENCDLTIAYMKGFADGKDQKPSTGDMSDGYHTFDELYEHRHALFSALCQFTDSWKSRLHSDGTMFDGGWFIAGIKTPAGQATYHLPIIWWDFLEASELPKAPEWDGHTAKDTVDRLKMVKRVSTGDSPPQPQDADRAAALGYEICGETLFFGVMRQDGSKLDEIWYSNDLKGITDEAKERYIMRAEYLKRAAISTDQYALGFEAGKKSRDQEIKDNVGYDLFYI